jgi:hypothetical protein
MYEYNMSKLEDEKSEPGMGNTYIFSEVLYYSLIFVIKAY